MGAIDAIWLGTTALDFEARLSNVVSETLSRYRIIHFATHSILDTIHPDNSGIVLSLYDPSGKVQDGFLRLRDLYQLRLSADLVVLSACDTALGREVRGEGMVGFSRGFMYAGVPSLVLTLWKVDDTATAEFMRIFYRCLLVKKEMPSEALHDAQVAMSHNSIWHDPSFWAAFVLEGDWR